MAQEHIDKHEDIEQIPDIKVPLKEATTKRAYTLVSSKERKELLGLILKERMTIKDAAESLKINYSNAKSIVRIFLKERRVEKIPHDLLRKRRKPEQGFQVALPLDPQMQPFDSNTQVASQQILDILVQNSNEQNKNSVPKKLPHLNSEELSKISFNMPIYTHMINQSFEKKLENLKMTLRKLDLLPFKNETEGSPLIFKP